MMANGPTGETWEVAGRLWRFAQCEFDESSRVLRLNGQPVELESKPLELLYQLLLHAGEVVTKEELLEAVWPGVTVVEGSLATAVSKLRKALEDDAPSLIVTIPRIGYRLGVPVQSKRIAARGSPELGFKPGAPVPGREQWQFVRRMDDSGSSEVWLAEHPKTHESRVFKFAADGVRLKGIKREVTLARFLTESLGDRPDFVRVLEWNFDTPPFYLESEYCGQNLLEWAAGQDGLDRIPFDTPAHCADRFCPGGGCRAWHRRVAQGPQTREHFDGAQARRRLAGQSGGLRQRSPDGARPAARAGNYEPRIHRRRARPAGPDRHPDVHGAGGPGRPISDCRGGRLRAGRPALSTCRMRFPPAALARMGGGGFRSAAARGHRRCGLRGSRPADGRRGGAGRAAQEPGSPAHRAQGIGLGAGAGEGGGTAPGRRPRAPSLGRGRPAGARRSGSA